MIDPEGNKKKKRRRMIIQHRERKKKRKEEKERERDRHKMNPRKKLSFFHIRFQTLSTWRTEGRENKRKESQWKRKKQHVLGVAVVVV